MMNAPPVPLKALRILAVEDEMLLIMLIEDVLTEAGCTVLTASRVATAIPIAQTEAIDCAILDVNLAGEEIYPVAVILQDRNIPFVLSTGYGRDSLQLEYRDRPLLAKPYLPEHIEQAILTALSEY